MFFSTRSYVILCYPAVHASSPTASLDFPGIRLAGGKWTFHPRPLNTMWPVLVPLHAQEHLQEPNERSRPFRT